MFLVLVCDCASCLNAFVCINGSKCSLFCSPIYLVIFMPACSVHSILEVFVKDYNMNPVTHAIYKLIANSVSLYGICLNGRGNIFCSG